MNIDQISQALNIYLDLYHIKSHLKTYFPKFVRVLYFYL